GDAFLAGFVAARRAGRAVEECLAYGVACGAESTQHLGAGTIDGTEAARLTSRVEVSRLTAPLRVASIISTQLLTTPGGRRRLVFPQFPDGGRDRPVVPGAYNRSFR